MLSKEFIKKVFRFGLIGISGMVVDYGVTLILKEGLLVDKYIANFFGFALAATSNYVLNTMWVFKEESRSHRKQYFGFITIATMGLIINSGIIWFLTDFALRLNFYLSKAIAIGIVFIWNFSLNYFINFRKVSA